MTQISILTHFQPTREAMQIEDFIRKILSGSGCEGIVVGLSGGIDSSFVATFAQRAIDSSHVLGVLLPTSFTPPADITDARAVADQLKIPTESVPIDGIVESYRRSLKATEDLPETKIPLANLRARVRMTILYWFANRQTYLVAGTGDKSEDLVGYFTKYEDGGVDFLPIGHLYKT